ncbi:MAG: hypothetical protein K0R57_6460, partial [Paenibacillaceae bacterium]|nr:hypothetical protein [Paenibacillaceae bacterium]
MNIKSLVALGLAVLLFLTPVASATAAPVSEGAVGQAAEAGLIPAGFLVKEDATITRAEFLDLTDRLYTALQTAPVPVDPGNAGEAVTLQEASAILVELIDAAFGDADVGLYTETVFDDNWQLSGEYRPAVNYLYHYGVIGTPGVYKIYPQQKLTVRQAADLVYKIYAAGNAGKFNMATAISEEWEWHIDPVYDGLGPNTKFSGGLAAVSLEGKYGYIDRFGIPVIPFQYDRGYDFSEGLAKVSQGGKVGYINKQGTVVIPLQYDDGGDFSEGRVWLKQDGKYGFADDRGIVLIPLQYEYAYPFRESLAPVKENGRYGYIDPWGKTVIPFQYTWASSFSEGLARTGSKGEYNYIDKTGQIALQLNYDYLFDFADGRAIVFNRDQYGVIDKSGNFLIPFGRWGLIYGFRNGLSVAHGNSGYEGNHSFINTGGDVVIGSQPFYDAEGFSEGLGTVASHNKVTDQVTRSYITRNGELILPKRTDIKSVSPYDANAFYLQAFSEGLAAVVTAEGKLGFIQNPLFKRPVEGAAVLEGSSQAAAGAGYDLTYGLRMAKNVSAQQIFLTYDRDLLDLQNPVVLSGGTEIVQTKEVAPGQVRYLLASLGSSHQLESRVEVVKFHFITKQQVVSGKYTASVSAVLADEKGNERTAGPVWNAIPAASIAVTGEGGATGISAKGGTLQLLAEVLPGNADNRAVAWTLHNEDGTVTDKA